MASLHSEQQQQQQHEQLTLNSNNSPNELSSSSSSNTGSITSSNSIESTLDRSKESDTEISRSIFFTGALEVLEGDLRITDSFGVIKGKLIQEDNNRLRFAKRN